MLHACTLDSDDSPTKHMTHTFGSGQFERVHGRGVPNSKKKQKKPPARVIWGSIRAPTETELELQLTVAGLQLTAVGCN